MSTAQPVWFILSLCTIFETTVSANAGIEPRTFAVYAFTVRAANYKQGYISFTLGYISSTLDYISSTLDYISSTLGFI